MELPAEKRRELKAWLRSLIEDRGVTNARELSRRLAAKFDVEWDHMKIMWAFRPEFKLSTARTTVNLSDADDSVQLPVSYDEVKDMAAEFLSNYSPLRPVPERVRTTKLDEMGFDTKQDAVALFSDLHYYSRIDRRVSAGLAEYNIDIARERLARWRDGVLRFTQMSQIVMDIDTLHLVALGDELEGHGAMFPTQALQMSESIFFQVMGFVEDMTSIILSLLERYKTIKVYKVHGNHGRAAKSAKEAYGPDNWELMAWHLVAERVARHVGGEWSETQNGVKCLTGGPVEFYISPAFIMFLEIQGWNTAIRHGHGIKGLQATYTGALANKFRLNAVVGEVINYYFKGHLHEAQASESEIRGEVIQNGCFVGPSLLSVEMSAAAANLPSQEFMLFHPDHGKTHHYRIHLADESEIRQHEWVGRLSGSHAPEFVR